MSGRARVSTRRAAALAALLFAGSASAQGGPAEALLRRGVELRTRGLDAEAVDVFREAYRRAPTPVAAGQLGLCEQALGRWIDAERHLREALAAPDDAWVRRQRAALDAAYAANARRVGVLEILGGVEGAEVRIDGARVGTLPLAEPPRVLVGEATLEVHAEGHYDVSRRVVIAPGVTRESVELRPLPPPRPAAPAPPVAAPALVAPPPPAVTPSRPVTSSGGALRTLGWVSLGGAAAAVVTAAVAVAVREDAASEFNASCVAGVEPAGRCRELLATGDAMAATAIVGASVGALLLTAWGVSRLVPAGPARRALASCAPDAGARGAACAWTF